MITNRQKRLNKLAAQKRIMKNILTKTKITVTKAVVDMVSGELIDKLTTVKIPSKFKMKVVHFNQHLKQTTPKNRAYRFINGTRNKKGRFQKGILANCI